MKIIDLQLINFKNLREASLELDGDVNCFSGLNGEGKTNILDAVRYLSMCKSYFNASDSQNITHGEESFMIKSTVLKNEEKDILLCTVRKSAKKIFKKNTKEYQRLSDHIGLYPSVMISPTDEDLIKEGSETRRKFMNGIISQYDRGYLNELVQYKRVLNQRNRLLKHFLSERNFELENLQIYDYKLIDLSEKIHQKREKFIASFVPWFQQLHETITGKKEKVSIEYKTTCSADLEKQFKDSLAKDRMSARTNVGIHKDDLDFLIEGFPLKKFGSQGQQKSLLIALKLAQSLFIEEATGLKPLLLLDDIFDKLDETRVGNLMKLVSEQKFGQIFITDTDLIRVPKLFTDIDIKLKKFHVVDGQVKEYE